MLPDTFTPQFLSQIELLRIRSRRAFLGSRQGGHISLKRGHGIEFSDYRKYELGDNPRHIDWGVFARTERLYVKRFQEEQDLSVLLLLDISASMAVPEGEKKWEAARDLALSLAYIALMEHDSVFISMLGGFHSPSFYGGRAIHAINKLLARTKPLKSANWEREVQRAMSRIRFPGVAIFISDFLMPNSELEKIFNILRSRNLDITAVQVLSPSDIDPLRNTDSALAVDSETDEIVEVSLDPESRGQYTKLLSEHNERLKAYLYSSHIPYALFLSSGNLSEFIQGDLSQTGLLG